MRKVMLVDIEKAHFFAPIQGEQYVDMLQERASWGEVRETSLHPLWAAKRSQQGQ